MDRKQGIIRLGRSKSPNQSRQKRPLPHQRNDSFSTSRNTWEKEPLQESINFTQTFSDSLQLKINKTENFKPSQTFSGFFPPSPENVIQRVIIKENIRNPPNIQLTTKSPPNLVNAIQPPYKIENHEMTQNSPNIISQKQTQLQRKVKLLQGRIQQLHNQKQASIIHSHQQNKKLCIKNQSLQNQISNIQTIKNQQINILKQEIQILKIQQINLNHSNFTHKLSQPKIPTNSPTNQNYQSKIKSLQEENFNLKKSLSQIKPIQNPSITTQTINNYQTKIQTLSQQINNYQKTQKNIEKIQKQLEFSQKSCQDYVSRLLQKSKQLTNKQIQCKQLKQSLNQTNSSKIQQINHELLTVQNQCAELRKQLQTKENLPNNDESQKITQLTEQITQKQKNLQQANKIITQLQQKIQKLTQKPQTVKRETTKSSSKLKSKNYSRAI